MRNNVVHAPMNLNGLERGSRTWQVLLGSDDNVRATNLECIFQCS